MHTMADDSSKSHETQDFASRSAMALRDLELRARTALAINREQVARLEADITGQLEAIAATLASERAADSQNVADSGQMRSELERLAAEYEAAKAEWSAERNSLELAREEHLRQAAKLEADQRKARDEWARQLTEFEHKLREQQSDWNTQRTEWSATRAALEVGRASCRERV